MSRPKGLLGVRWGTDADRAARELGLACESWEPIADAPGFEACTDPDHLVTAFGRRAEVRLIRDAAGIAAIELTFFSCGRDWAALRDQVTSEFRLSTPEDATANRPARLYQTWGGGALVHLTAPEPGDTCRLTVAGPAYGAVFADRLLASGLANLATKLMPR